MSDPANSERWPAVLLSLLWPGLGQLSLGRTSSGWMFASLTAIACLVALFAAPGSGLRWLALLSMAELALWSVLGAFFARRESNGTQATA